MELLLQRGQGDRRVIVVACVCIIIVQWAGLVSLHVICQQIDSSIYRA